MWNGIIVGDEWCCDMILFRFATPPLFFYKAYILNFVVKVNLVVLEFFLNFTPILFFFEFFFFV